MLELSVPKKYLVSVNPKTNTIEERYISGKYACETNEGYNYNSLMNAINKKITYKGYIWKWIYRDSDENANVDVEFRQELLNTLNALKEINEKLQCHTAENNAQSQDGK